MSNNKLVLLMTSSLLFTGHMFAKDDDKDRGRERDERKERGEQPDRSLRIEKQKDQDENRERKNERDEHRQRIETPDRGRDEIRHPRERIRTDVDRSQRDELRREEIRHPRDRIRTDVDRHQRDELRREEIRLPRDKIRIDVERDRTDRRVEPLSRERLKERERHWDSRSKHWKRDFKDYRKRERIFDDYFWNSFRTRHRHWYFDNRFRWNVESSWPSVIGWLPWQMSQPIYYYYGTDGMVYYSTTQDFTYLIPVGSRERFVAEAAVIANTSRPFPRNQSDWLPLGMFALALDDDSFDMPKKYISLAISKQGAVTGAYFDVSTNDTREIQGSIDPQSQRVAWKFVGEDWPIMESGLYNLTREESTVLIHTSFSRTNSQLIIRLR